MRLKEYDYELPEELIAQEPIDKRDHSRLLILNKCNGNIEHKQFFEIIDYLREDDTLVFNNTRVSAYRLYGNKYSGAEVEALLTQRLSCGIWEAICKPGKRLKPGAVIDFGNNLIAEVIDTTKEGGRILKFNSADNPDENIMNHGLVPLPPYIYKNLADKERYQTVYAKYDGSAAAPTAGLHFTSDLIGNIQKKGIRTAFITLHVGVATFRPVKTENIEDHDMHTEYFEISEQNAEIINNTKGRIVSVGTTTVRALESAAVEKRKVSAVNGSTKLFIKPGYQFKIVDALITNFHMPRTTLLIMVSTLSSRDFIINAYNEAVKEKYRFLSFGDAMFIC
ncbi:MAG: tRNA preQ1(34) S-adenosylmethionine ribosyltransferase-isomerase QueA [Armatimonadota bacterium]